MKTFNLHFNSMLHVHNNEPSNPHRRLSSAWYAWEAIAKARKRGLTVIDAWCGRGCAVNIRTIAGNGDKTTDSVTSVYVL